MNVPIILLFINSEGLSIDLSTCVSAAKWKMISGLLRIMLLANVSVTKFNFINLYLSLSSDLAFDNIESIPVRSLAYQVCLSWKFPRIIY